MKTRIRFSISIFIFIVLCFHLFSPGTTTITGQSIIKHNLQGLSENTSPENPLFLPLILKNASLLPKLIIWTDSSRYDVMQTIATEYEASHDVDVVVEQIDDVYGDFLTAVPIGQGPDIAIFAHDRLGRLYNEGLISPIDLGEKETDFTTVSLDTVSMGSDYYALPYATENLAFFYNTNLISTPPTSWDEVHTMGQALQDSEDVTWGFVFSGPSYDVYPLMTANSGYVFGVNPDGSYNTDDLGIDSAGMIAFGEMAKTWADEGFLSTDLDWNNAQIAFETGAVPWLMTGPWSLDRIRNAGINYGIADFPDGHPFSGAQVFIVNAHSDKQTLAASFLIDFVATTDVMLTLFDDGFRSPAYIPALEQVTDSDVKKIGEIGVDAEPMPNIPEMACVWGPWSDALTYILNDEKTPTDAYTDAEAQIRECIDNPLTGMVNVPGSYQTEVGCSSDWDPACEMTALTDNLDGTYTGTFSIPTGDWECKVALDGTWEINYGLGGVLDGDNIPFTVPPTGDVTFTYHSDTHILDITTP